LQFVGILDLMYRNYHQITDYIGTFNLCSSLGIHDQASCPHRPGIITAMYALTYWHNEKIL